MPDDENSDLFPELVAAVPPPLVAPTEPVTSIQAAALDRHSASKPARSAPLPSSGQLILGADQRNPLLTVYHDEEHQQLRVYYSFEIIEIVPDDTQAGSYKLLLGAISKVSGNTQDILAQWLAALWLGAAHIKQTKFLHWEDLEMILGLGVRYPTHQREKL